MQIYYHYSSIYRLKSILLLVVLLLSYHYTTAEDTKEYNDSILSIANSLVQEGKFDEAMTIYDDVLLRYIAEADTNGLIQLYYNRGKLLRNTGDFDHALGDMLKSLKLSELTDYKKGIAFAYLNIGIIYATRQGESSAPAIPYFEDALAISKEINDQQCMSFALNNLALVCIDTEEYDKALEYHQQSLALRKEKGDPGEIASALGNIADIYTLKEEYQTGIDYNLQTLELYTSIDDPVGIQYTILDIGRGYTFMGEYEKARSYLQRALDNLDKVQSLQVISTTYEYLYILYEATGDYQQALKYHIQFNQIEDSIYSEYNSQQIAEMRTQFETEKRESEIIQLTNERIIQDLRIKKTENIRTFFIIAFVLTLIIAAFAYYGYHQKQLANKHLEMRNRFEVENKKRAISLFGQQVSKEVALELLSDSFKSGSKKLFACIMFLDIRDFTPYVADKEPDEIIQYQNDVFGFMIDVISKYHGIINQFMGDGFMATFGAPLSSGNDCQNAVDAALEIVDMLNSKTLNGNLPPTRVGIGLHAGYIVTGNVGTAQRKQYSITGNTVILASRIEQLNKKYASEILISKEVYEQTDIKDISTHSLGEVLIKGRAQPVELFKIG